MKQNKIVTFIPIMGAIAVFLFSALILTKDTGLANNGDFYRIMKVNRIAFADETDQAWRYQSDYMMELNGETFFQNLISTWSTAQEELYDSPQFFLVKIAKTISYLFNCVIGAPRNLFRIEALSGIYLLLYSFAVWGILSFFQTTRTKLAALFLLLFVFCDMGYLLYFHSFYGEALQFVCVMLLIAGLLHLSSHPSGGWFFTVLCSAYFLAGAKLANIPYALCCIAVAAVMIRKRKIMLAFSLATGVGILFLFGSIPTWMNHDTTYQSVFFGILKESPSPEQDIKELGLPAEYVSLQNTHAYLEQYPIEITSQEFQQNFYEKIGKTDVVKFYAHHPIRLLNKLTKAITYSGSIRPPSLANSGTVRMGIINQFSGWSHIRLSTKLFYHPWFVWPLLGALGLGGLFWTIKSIRQKQGIHQCLLYLLLVAGLFVNLLLPIAGNGEADLAKHMFFFIHLMDITLAAGILLLISKAPVWRWKGALPALGILLLGCICAYQPQKEKTVSFGGYDWTVISQTETTQTLLCNQTVANLPFDRTEPYGDNLWAKSELREWLNNELFPVELQSQLLPMTYQVCVSGSYKQLAETGWHPHIWTHEANTVASLWQDAYRMTVTDRVALPTVRQYEAGNFKRELGQDYWLADPYGGNDSMVRYADPFGQVLHRDASQSAGVRPVITIKK